MEKLFESRKVLASRSAIPSPDGKIIFTKAPFVQYKELLLDKNCRQYLEKDGSTKNTDAENI